MTIRIGDLLPSVNRKQNGIDFVDMFLQPIQEKPVCLEDKMFGRKTLQQVRYQARSKQRFEKRDSA